MAYFRLETYLNFYNLTQKDLSDGTGINRNTINRYCKNTFEKITKEHLDLLTSYFQCSISDILTTDNDSLVKYPSDLIKKTILENKVPYDYVCVNGYDTSTNEREKIEFIEPDKPNKRTITGDDALETARIFEEQNGYNPIMSDDEIYKYFLERENQKYYKNQINNRETLLANSQDVIKSFETQIMEKVEQKIQDEFNKRYFEFSQQQYKNTMCYQPFSGFSIKSEDSNKKENNKYYFSSTK